MKFSPLYRILILLGVVSILFIYLTYYAPTPVISTPCSPDGLPGRCYHVAKEACEIVWSKAETDCEQYLKTLSLPAGRLTGPIASKCQLVHFDRAFSNSRKSNAECDEIVSELKSWQRRNDFNP